MTIDAKMAIEKADKVLASSSLFLDNTIQYNALDFIEKCMTKCCLLISYG
ncbi:MAG: hypothetical protein QOK71_11345 [Nitrososphaeraceae archaeon]|nr:hypothetical protein [Nitrososphaeraceae archaeon]